ncbi:MAG: hypothetical protein KGY78_01495 [Anaerolineae bacterium]|nr:hypothetical protein [Anaerolineae bacterium]
MPTDGKGVSGRKPVHDWLRDLDISFVPGPGSQLSEDVAKGLLWAFQRVGHHRQAVPDDSTDVILTTAPFGEPLDWREALLFTARRRFGLDRAPAIYTLVSVTAEQFERVLSRIHAALKTSPPEPDDYDFPGLAESACQVLHEQGHRGGPILALQRVIQSQAKCIDVLLIVGDEIPREAYLFNLVGAYPRMSADEPEDFYQEIVTRIVTARSTHEVTNHAPIGEPISRQVWANLGTPQAMCEAGKQLGLRGFFTETVRIADLVNVPAVANSVSSQYSEGCFSTWDPTLDALVATVTGSARPIYKGSITEQDLTVVAGLKADGSGALVRRIEGRGEAPPSSEAVEMVMMDDPLPRITLGHGWGNGAKVPVVRSKLHGHRGCARYDPRRVEYVPMAPPYHHYPVTCATEAQARGIADAFAQAEALQNPEDPRRVVFTVLPGHGIVVVEKWVAGAAPFQTIWETMDAGSLEIDKRVPQGPIDYVSTGDGMQVVRVGE